MTKTIKFAKLPAASAEEKLVTMLIQKNLKIASCESCTGGLFCATLINVPCASSVVESSVVTYSNEAKIKFAKVKEITLQKFGAVSEQTAREMAGGIRKTCGADIGVGITGIAGPGGATPTKPVGMVCFGININGSTQTCTKFFKGTRAQVRRASVRFAINEIIRLLIV